ncbi:acyltransferase family protein [Caenimonas koreensis]|uniref:acyltransferase family protein n=1 Tax=Caenimonas koreensis TaxID=367474 RepID=UPI0037831221
MRDESPNLDLLRTIAVALVYISHLLNYVGWGYDGAFRLTSLGFMGVAIFFVHTSLVLMMSMHRQQPGPLAVPFFIRRVMRIYPLSITAVLVMTLAAVMQQRPVDAWVVVTNLLLVQNIADVQSIPPPLWSLPYEVQMYLLLPAVFIATRSAGRVRFVLLGWVLSIVAFALAWTGGWFLGAVLLKYVPCFLPGIVAYLLMRDRERRASFPPARFFGVLVLCVALIPVAAACGSASAGDGLGRTLIFAWGLCMAIGLMLPFVRQIRNPQLTAIVKTIATYSYGIYLIHAPVMDLMFARLHAPWVVQFAASVALTALIVFAAHHLIEQPAIRLGRRLSQSATAV